MTENSINDLCHAPEAGSFAECMGVTDVSDSIEGDAGETSDVAAEIQLQAEIDRLTSQIEPLEDERKRLQQQLLELQSPFKPGDVIEWNKGRRKGRVVKVEATSCGGQMWIVRRILKRGNDGFTETVYSSGCPRKVMEASKL